VDLAEYPQVGYLGVLMGRVRGVLAATMSMAMLATPLWSASAPASQLGIVVFADRARVGVAPASVGSTVFGGDKLTTEADGSVQIRSGAARFLLASSRGAILSNDDSSPAATLISGTATFSTANANAFTLRFANATIRANTDEPTVGQVSVMSSRELLVKSTRGSLLFSVAGETKIIPEGTAFRVILDPTAAEAAAAEATPGGGGGHPKNGPPVSAGTSKFVWYAVAVVAAATIIAVHAAYESPDRP
jgi:hypothetical protein